MFNSFLYVYQRVSFLFISHSGLNMFNLGTCRLPKESGLGLDSANISLLSRLELGRTTSLDTGVQKPQTPIGL